jgi:hypothetical protein
MGDMLRPRNLLRPAVRYPADPRAIFILALSVFSGMATLLIEEGPPTLESLLPQWGIMIWSATLALGSLIALVGLARDTDWGIVTEQVGCVMVGAATVYYSVLAFVYLGLAGSSIIAVVLGWGLACLMRWFQLQLLVIDNIEKRQVEQFHSHVDKMREQASNEDPDQ